MDEQEQQAASEGGIGQSASTGGLERRVIELWNRAVKETGDATYPAIIAKFANFVAAAEREACATECADEAKAIRREGEGSTNAQYDWMADGAERCVEALRSNVEHQRVPAGTPLHGPVGPRGEEE